MAKDEQARSAGEALERLAGLIARLRAPGGCPWDREQTHESLKPMTIEEAYEVVEAIDLHDDRELASELGDLLLQVVFHSQIAAEGGRFTLADVLAHVTDKMVRRHPHVFGGERADTPSEVLRNWEAIKASERTARSELPDQGSMLDSVSTGLPAVMEAYQVTTKASRVGFDWPDVDAVLAKLHEEIAELKEAVGREDARPREVAEEVGDLFFAAVNLARILGIDPESALKAANRKFRRRFRFVEQGLRRAGRAPGEAGLDEMEALWNEAKRLEAGREEDAS